MKNFSLKYLRNFVIQTSGLSLGAMLLLGALTPNRLAHASSQGRFAMGVIVGEPSGLSARYWLDQKAAVDFALGYSFNNYMFISSDYKLNFHDLIRANGQHFHPYLGVGVSMAFANSSKFKGFGNGSGNFGMAMRVPFGIEWLINRSPLGVFFELAPGIGIIPGTYGFFDAGIGIRYYF